MQNSVSHLSQKIVDREALTTIVQELKAQSKTIVTTNGSFDLLHIGHVMLLQEAKSLGDVLIVGLNSDASVRSYKGTTRPICPQEHRAEMLAALACTDYITIFDELTPIELLAVMRPHIHVNSPEHGKDCVEREVVERHGGHIHLAQLVEGISTSQLIEKISEVVSQTPCRAIFIKADDIFESAVNCSTDALSALHQFNARGFHIFCLPSEHGKTPEHEIKHIFDRQGVKVNLISSIERAVADHDIILAKSLVVSRAMADIRMGRELNCKTILLSNTSENQDQISPVSGPHFIARDLCEVLEWATNIRAIRAMR